MVVMVLPDRPEPTVELVLPERKVLPVLRALMASQGQMGLPDEAERRARMVRPALRGLGVVPDRARCSHRFFRSLSVGRQMQWWCPDSALHSSHVT